jgi:DNA polymerase III subunit epsilon
MQVVRRRAYHRRCMDLAEMELRSTEFVAVDTETNGRAGEDCELTEVGAVLVGGGELHERMGSLVAVRNPLSRGIQRFTGITEAMVAEAPAPEAVLPGLARMLDGRVLVAHSASFDRRVLRQAFARAELEWPDPPVLCTVALARRFAPLVGQRKLAPLADALGIDVRESHRALADAETCARVFCALFPRLCANAPTLADALALLSPRRRTAKAKKRAQRVPPAERPDLRDLPNDPGVYIFRDADGRALYVGKSVSLRTRARSHFTAAAEWTGETEIVDHRSTQSELGALVLENRLIKTLRPPANVALKRVDPHVFIVCRLDAADYPILEVSAAPAPGHAVSVGPLRGRSAARELVEQMQSLFGLRHCARRLVRREHPSAYGQMGRCLSPCLGDLDPNLYRARLDAALELFAGPGDGSSLLLAHIEAQMAAAAADQLYERAAWLRRRHRRLEVLIERLGGVLRATHADPRLVLAGHPREPRYDAFWIVGGRLADWGELPADLDELEARTAAAIVRAPRPGENAHVPAEEIDEVRIVSGWLASHQALTLALDPAPERDALEAFAAQAVGSMTQNSR